MIDNVKRIAVIKEKITAAINVVAIDVQDDSHLHVGHAGAKDGAGHFTVTVISNEFSGMSYLSRHRKIYQAVGEMIPNEIHALVIRPNTPLEAEEV
jgi:BolA protein